MKNFNNNYYYHCLRSSALVSIGLLWFFNASADDYFNGPIILNPVHSGNGPIAIYNGDHLWGSTYNPGVYIGYNQTSGGVPILYGEPGLSLGIEGNYWVEDGNNKMEVYLQYIDGVGGPPLRPFFFSVRRQTGRIDSAFIGGSPRINFGDANDPMLSTINASIDTNTLTLYSANTASDAAISVKAAPGHTGALLLGYNGQDGALSLYPYAPNGAVVVVGGHVISRLYGNPNGGNPSGSIAVGGINDNSAIGVFDTEKASNNVKGMVVRGKPTMSVNVLEVQAQDQTVLHGVDKTGVVYMANSPGPDSNPTNGVYLYVDSADNKLKYRDASGTIHVVNTTP